MIQPFMVKYILITIVPFKEWASISYQRKKLFHYLVTVSGKVIPIKPLLPHEGTVEIVFVGSDVYANENSALFGLLIDLCIKHYESKIIYALDLNKNTAHPFLNAGGRLLKKMPVCIQRKLSAFKNLLTIRSLLPLI